MQFSTREMKLIALALAVGAIAGGLYMRPAATYDQCVVDEMRGQPANLTLIVIDLCRKRFGRDPLPTF